MLIISFQSDEHLLSNFYVQGTTLFSECGNVNKKLPLSLLPRQEADRPDGDTDMPTHNNNNQIV